MVLLPETLHPKKSSHNRTLSTKASAEIDMLPEAFFTLPTSIVFRLSPCCPALFPSHITGNNLKGFNRMNNLNVSDMETMSGSTVGINHLFKIPDSDGYFSAECLGCLAFDNGCQIHFIKPIDVLTGFIGKIPLNNEGIRYFPFVVPFVKQFRCHPFQIGCLGAHGKRTDCTNHQQTTDEYSIDFFHTVCNRLSFRRIVAHER